ncbi:MAG: disulfide bond formation protein B [Gammaproteobacteria bacterium]|nr:disulfide bond formation protein B [Gammaproteobacteria bacterium]
MPPLDSRTGSPPVLTTLFHPRLLFAATFLACAGLLGCGSYLQFHDGLEPCPMCIFQRLCFMAAGIVAVVGAAHGPRARGATVYGALVTLAAGVGAAIAARQVWLQHLPEDQVPACGPGLEYMLEMWPLAEVVKKALRGTGECATVDWTFLGASIAEWSLVCFVILATVHLAAIVHRLRGPRTAA